MTIAQQLKIKEFPFEIKDSNGKLIYYENSKGEWSRREYDSEGYEIYFENSEREWTKREYDSNGNLIYCETMDGVMLDKRPKTELILDEIAQKFGIPVSKLKQLVNLK